MALQVQRRGRLAADGDVEDVDALERAVCDVRTDWEARPDGKLMTMLALVPTALEATSRSWRHFPDTSPRHRQAASCSPQTQRCPHDYGRNFHSCCLRVGALVDPVCRAQRFDLRLELDDLAFVRIKLPSAPLHASRLLRLSGARRVEVLQIKTNSRSPRDDDSPHDAQQIGK
jgi:hypothetical protein